ncbi:MAG: N-acetyl-1-D-myo-inositol-2-amino-2-deoxy-alpha-D-glucopyranoside deacetylase [Micromonosporaceae bacterium]|nr:N-acetyl-1-D-myo-inositol-2-amino-2-deoxy-alpha-D-glucopyranoside deacetylase [Micromonosporaceae bacterium]
MQQSILFVHAHPDDETIGTGATLARYAKAGARVTLVTCTLGEEGEIHIPGLSGLVAAEADQLGGYRLGELERACEILGVQDHRFLGGAGRFRDSGMMGLPANDHPRAFCRAELDAAASLLLDVIREVRPQVVVTYAPNGFYGHPDHVQAYRVTMRAVALAAGEGNAPDKVYWTAMPSTVADAGIRQFAGTSDNPFSGIQTAEDLPFVTPPDHLDARIDAGEHGEAKREAIRAHATQIPATSWLLAIAGNFGAEPMGVEYYRLALGQRGPGSGEYGWETDLFAGLPVAS